LLFVGEAPARNGWRITGRAWRDAKGKIIPSGKVLQKLLNYISLNLDDITFIETVKCFPETKRALSVASKMCGSNLYEQIKLMKPRIIIPLGAHPTKVILERNFSCFKEVVGQEFDLRLDNLSFKVFPIYHPSPISPKSYLGNISLFEHLRNII